MLYYYLDSSEELKSATARTQEQSPPKTNINRIIFLYDSTQDNGKPQQTSSAFAVFYGISGTESSLETPWQEHFSSPLHFETNYLKLEESFTSNIRTLNFEGRIIDNVEILLQIDKALASLYRRTKVLAEDLFYDIRSVPPSRSPGFVIDGWIVIPKYDRSLERSIYKELGDVIRSNPNLLFNIHLVARKGKDFSEALPENYQKYNPWLEYVC